MYLARETRLLPVGLVNLVLSQYNQDSVDLLSRELFIEFFCTLFCRTEHILATGVGRVVLDFSNQGRHV
jgi:hypothetical protein